MSRTRTLAQTVKSTKPTPPTQVNGWNQLLSQVIKQAEAIGDPRLAALRKAMMDGRSESVLRKFGILSASDVDREFPIHT